MAGASVQVEHFLHAAFDAGGVPDQYIRLQPDISGLPESCQRMDISDPADLERLQALTAQYIDANADTIHHIASQFAGGTTQEITP